MRASCTSRVRLEVRITTGGRLGAERAELGHGDLVVGQHLEQEGLELVVGPVDLVDQQDRRRALRRWSMACSSGPLDEEALVVELVLERVGRRRRPPRRWPRRPAGGGAGGRSPTRRRPGRRRCPRSTAGGSARRRSSAPAPWPPRSCPRRPRPRAAAVGAGAGRGRRRWPGPRRGGSRGATARRPPRSRLAARSSSSGLSLGRRLLARLVHGHSVEGYLGLHPVRPGQRCGVSDCRSIW